MVTEYTTIQDKAHQLESSVGKDAAIVCLNEMEDMLRMLFNRIRPEATAGIQRAFQDRLSNVARMKKLLT